MTNFDQNLNNHSGPDLGEILQLIRCVVLYKPILNPKKTSLLHSNEASQVLSQELSNFDKTSAKLATLSARIVACFAHNRRICRMFR